MNLELMYQNFIVFINDEMKRGASYEEAYDLWLNI